MYGSVGAARLQRVGRSRTRSRELGDACAGAQGGFSLIEILICIVLIGTVIMALAAGMLTMVRTTGVTTQRQQIQFALASYTESLKAGPYLTCTPNVAAPTPASYETKFATWAPMWAPDRPGMTARILNVEYWSESAGPSGGFVTTCPATGDQATQRLTVQVDYRTRTGTAQVVTSYRPDAP